MIGIVEFKDVLCIRVAEVLPCDSMFHWFGRQSSLNIVVIVPKSTLLWMDIWRDWVLVCYLTVLGMQFSGSFVIFFGCIIWMGNQRFILEDCTRMQVRVVAVGVRLQKFTVHIHCIKYLHVRFLWLELHVLYVYLGKVTKNKEMLRTCSCLLDIYIYMET